MLIQSNRTILFNMECRSCCISTERNYLFAVIKSAWMDDQKNYFPDIRILPLNQSFKQDKQKELLIE